jgi:Flp pilus assembly protein TadD
MSSNFEEKELMVIQHYLEIGRYKNAEELMNTLLEKNPTNAKLLNTMAYIQIQLDDLDKAEMFCKESIALGELNEECYYLLGVINMERRNYVEAEESLLESLRHNPENPRVFAKYGYLMLKTGHDEKAEKLLTEALKIAPHDPVVIDISFQFYLVKNNKEQQLLFLSKYLQYSDNEIGKLVKVGVIELRRGNYKAARESFIQAYLLDPTNEELLLVIEEVDKDYHPIFFPQRMISKIGGPAVVWVMAVVIIIGLSRFGFSKLSFIFSAFYVLLCIYSWLAPTIYQRFLKK